MVNYLDRQKAHTIFVLKLVLRCSLLPFSHNRESLVEITISEIDNNRINHQSSLVFDFTSCPPCPPILGENIQSPPELGDLGASIGGLRGLS
jgi:hypothetical protein